MATAPHGHGWISYFLGVLLNGAVFAAFGPPTGAFFSPGFFLLPFSIIIAYTTSTAAAFATGCCVGVASSFLTEPSRLYVFAALAGAVLGASAAGTVGDSRGSVLMITMFAVSGAIAAMACTRFARSVRLTRTNLLWRSLPR